MKPSQTVTMPQAAARIDQLLDEIDQCNCRIMGLALEARRLRRQVADRDGQINALLAKLAAAGGAQ